MDNKPNYILILPDQWRGDCLGCTGHPVVQTPCLNHIAGEGVTFTSAYSAAPTCIPARACLATGQTPSTHGRLGYQDGIPWNYEHTMMKCLRDGGYQTMQSGKTHFYPQRVSLGFEENRLYEIPIHDKDFESDYHIWLQRQTNGLVHDIARQADPNACLVKPWEYDEELHCTNWIMNNAIEMLWRRDPTRPFFMQIGIHRPHAPYDPPRAYYEMYANAELPNPRVGDWAEEYGNPTSNLTCWSGKLPDKTIDQMTKAYYASITHIDYQIGKLYNWLKKEKLLEKTYLIFMSDHGEQLGDHHQFRKASPFEGSAKIPFIIRPPKGSDFKTNDTCSSPVSHMDVMPTLLELAGINIPNTVEGSSLIRLLKGQFENWREFIHGEHANNNHGWQFLTDGKEKYIWETMSGSELFFDIDNDSQEKRNLVKEASYSKRVELWRGRLIEILAQRPQDGLSDRTRLIPGKVLPNTRS